MTVNGRISDMALSKEVFKREIEKLEAVYNYNLAKAAPAIWYQELKEESITDQDLIDGIKLYRRESKYHRLPSLDDLKDYCDVVKLDRYAKEEALKKSRNIDAAKAFSRKIAGAEEEKARLIRKALAKTIDKKELAAEMMKLDVKYPGAGWAEEAEALIN